MSDPVTAPNGAPVPARFVPQSLPPARWADPSKALRAVPLGLAVVDDAGKTHSAIYVRKFSVAQIAVIIENWTEARRVNEDAPLSFPSYVDEKGVEIPPTTMELLEDDDMMSVREAAEAFLPRRFRPDPAPVMSPAPSGPSTGATTEPSSDA